jgi:SagB-type dehydrogenase family enzyme
VARGSCVIVIGAVFGRITSKYGDRGVRYAHMEAGHVSQNIYLQAAALGLGTVAVGAFYDERVRSVMRMEDNEAPLYIMPVGKPK